MKLILVILLSSSMSFFSSCNNTECFEKAEGDNCACYEIYKPVCGCNNVTYPNDCNAECHGITDYSEGSCK